MLSIVLVGPTMSGKTRLCMELGQQHSSSTVGTTRSTSSIVLTVNGAEWHIWDTPAVCAADLATGGPWIAHDVLDEADVVVVCHDGRSDSSPIPLVRACGPDRCIIARTRGAASYHDLSYFMDYLRTTTSSGRLVPISDCDWSLLSTIHRIRPCHGLTKGSQGFVELE